MVFDIRTLDGAYRGGGGLVVLALVTVLVISGAVLSGCESPGAQRERARAERVLAEAQAYEWKQKADLAAEAERAAIHEAVREAEHRRMMEWLPYISMIAISVAAVCVSGVGLWYLSLGGHGLGSRAQPQARDSLAGSPDAMAIRSDLPPQLPSQNRAEYWRQIESRFHDMGEAKRE